jgi:hypothetical protein
MNKNTYDRAEHIVPAFKLIRRFTIIGEIENSSSLRKKYF